MALPYFQTKDQQVNQLQTTWKSQIDPIISNEILQNNFITGIKLAVGTNIINHKLQRNQQGWIITNINAASVIFCNADFNATTLSLHASAVCTIDLLVF